MLKNHHFNVEIAKHYGVFAAVILDQFIYWIDQNQTSGTHIHNGKAWACASYETLCKIFPYFTKRQIENAVDKLIKTGVIEVGFFAKNRFNRTRYFAFTDNFQSIVNSKDYTLLCDFQNSKNDGIEHPKNDGIEHPKNDGIEHPKNDGIEHPKNDGIDFTKMGNEISQNCEMDSTKMGNEISQNCEMLCTTSCTTSCTTTECTANSSQHAENGVCGNVEKPDFELTVDDEKPKTKIRQPESEVLDREKQLRLKTWEFYKQAYLERYGIEPVRNARVNRNILDFVRQVGANAPQMIYFFVFHNNSWYVQKGHDTGTLLQNIQAIARDWAKGYQTTQTYAKQGESIATAQMAAQGAIELLNSIRKEKAKRQQGA